MVSSVRGLESSASRRRMRHAGWALVAGLDAGCWMLDAGRWGAVKMRVSQKVAGSSKKWTARANHEAVVSRHFRLSRQRALRTSKRRISRWHARYGVQNGTLSRHRYGMVGLRKVNYRVGMAPIKQYPF